MYGKNCLKFRVHRFISLYNWITFLFQYPDIIHSAKWWQVFPTTESITEHHRKDKFLSNQPHKPCIFSHGTFAKTRQKKKKKIRYPFKLLYTVYHKPTQTIFVLWNRVLPHENFSLSSSHSLVPVCSIPLLTHQHELHRNHPQPNMILRSDWWTAALSIKRSQTLFFQAAGIGKI